MQRCILHADCNCFYASVEMLHRPETRQVPMAVGGDQERRHGIILAKNDYAKQYGIRTGEAIWEAKKKCADLVIVPPNFPLYLDFSHRVKQIFSRYTDQVESFGIDEAWLDVTGSFQLFGSGQEIADAIRQQVREELGITVSIGVSWNKIFAKLGSDIKKPDATTVITPDNFHQIVWTLPVQDLLYVGRATQKNLHVLGIHTIGQLAAAPRTLLQQNLGKSGEMLWFFANGLDQSPVAFHDTHAPVKSIGNSTTPPRDLNTPEDARLILTVLAESVAARLREHGMSCRTISVSTQTTTFKRSEFQCSLPRPCSETQTILQTALSLFHAHYSWVLPLRSLGIQLSGLCGENDPVQLDLFTNPTELMRQSALDCTIDRVRKRFGKQSVLRASLLMDPALIGFDPKSKSVVNTFGGYERG